MDNNTVKLIGYRLRKYGFNNLKEYYSSELWKKKKKEFKEKMKKEDLVFCFCCGRFSNYLQVHHKSYKSLCDENLDQLCYLCSSCHEKVHKIQKQENVSVKVATKILERKKFKGKNYAIKKKMHKAKSYSEVADKFDSNSYRGGICKVIKENGEEYNIITKPVFSYRKKTKKIITKDQRRYFEKRIGVKPKKKKKIENKYTEDYLRKIVYGL